MSEKVSFLVVSFKRVTIGSLICVCVLGVSLNDTLDYQLKTYFHALGSQIDLE